MKATAHLLPDGRRLHLQHGPSDLIVWAEGARNDAYRAATLRFQTIIAEIVEELAQLRQMLSPLSKRPKGAVARRMHDACLPFATSSYVTPMAAVAGSVADEVLAAMVQGAQITRAYVNNGGDIALYLRPGTSLTTAIMGHDGTDMGRIRIKSEDGVAGIATSGRHGRSLSLGIADSVTVLAGSAATADVAATLIGNAVDLPDHPDISRQVASALDENSDLGALPAVTSCASLSLADRCRALANGRDRAMSYQYRGLISAAALFLQGQSTTTGGVPYTSLSEEPNVPA